MNITIREATKKEAVLIADLSQRTFLETFTTSNTEENMHKFLHEQFTRGKLIVEVGQPNLQYFLAYVGHQIAGYVKLREGMQPEAIKKENGLEIARLYASKEFIGKGIGKALMEQSIEVAKGKNKQVIWLGVWEKNSRAIKFYQDWGFIKCGEHDFLLGNDLQTDWLMKKHI